MRRKIDFIETAENPFRLKFTYEPGRSKFYAVERPSQEAYEDLIADLADLTNSIGANTDQLTISIEAVRAVLEYLRKDATVYLSSVCQPLVNLLSAAEDFSKGAKAPLFEARPVNGAPTDLVRHRTRALIVLAMETLVKSDVPKEGAATQVARLLQEAGLANPLTGVDYEASQLIAMRTKAHDKTGPARMLKHLGDLNSEDAAFDLGLAGIEGDPAIMAWNLIKAAALSSPTSPDATVTPPPTSITSSRASEDGN